MLLKLIKFKITYTYFWIKITIVNNDKFIILWYFGFSDSPYFRGIHSFLKNLTLHCFLNVLIQIRLMPTIVVAYFFSRVLRNFQTEIVVQIPTCIYVHHRLVYRFIIRRGSIKLIRLNFLVVILRVGFSFNFRLHLINNFNV